MPPATPPYRQHQAAAATAPVACAVITLSDTRNEQSDKSGRRIQELLGEAGFTVSYYRIIPDDPAALESLLQDLKARPDVDVILTNGGTGISPRDQTIPVVQKLLACELPGFGELFRMLSYEQIQSGAMLSRAVGGVIDSSPAKLLFAMPGSTPAVELAMTMLILPELRHMISQVRKGVAD